MGEADRGEYQDKCGWKLHGSPERAGFSGLLRNHNGDWVHGFAGHLGERHILFAELFGLKTGLVIAWQLNYKNVCLETDFMEAFRLITQETHPFHGYGMLVADIKYLLSRQWTVEVTHTFREANQCADFLAKHGVNQRDQLRN